MSLLNLIKIHRKLFKNNNIAKDKPNNTIKTNYAEFNNIKKIFKTIGSTTLITSQNYSLEGNDIYFDYKDKNNEI